MDAANTQRDDVPRRRKWLRFSLRAALVVLTLACVWLAVVTNRARRQERAMAAVEQLGGYVQFDYGRGWSDRLTPNTSGRIETDNFTLSENNGDVPGTIWPRWLRRRLGEEYFRSVMWVNLGRRGPTDDDLRLLDDLPKLTGLWLFQNKSVGDDGLAHAAHLKKLEQLDFCGTGVTDRGMRVLDGLTKLKELWMFEVPGVTDVGMLHVSGLRSLELLDVRRNPQLTDGFLPHLRNLSKLERLELGGTSVTDSGLQHLSELLVLKNLGIGETQVRGPGLQYLSSLPLLTGLYLDGNRLGDEGAAHLCRFPRLKQLGLSRTGISDTGLKSVSEITTLTALNLMGNDITAAGIEHLAALKSLEGLDLTDTKITDNALKQLAGFASLKELTLPGATTTPAGIAELQKALPYCRIDTR